MRGWGAASHGGGQREFIRLTAAGVNPQTAYVLAWSVDKCGTERAYWRHLVHNRQPDAACKAAHAAEQRERRARQFTDVNCPVRTFGESQK